MHDIIINLINKHVLILTVKLEGKNGEANRIKGED
jgi:hypothetical protein